MIYELIDGENIVSHHYLPEKMIYKKKRTPLDSVIGNRIYYKKIYDLDKMKYYLSDEWDHNNKYAK